MPGPFAIHTVQALVENKLSPALVESSSHQDIHDFSSNRPLSRQLSIFETPSCVGAPKLASRQT